jgi:hypothetical protein
MTRTCIRYAEGYKYQLRAADAMQLPELADPARAPIATDWIELDPDGTMRFRPGYAWDGPSGPTIDTPSAMRGSLAHDGLYQLIREGRLGPGYREPADRVLRRLCLEDKMWKVRAWAWFHIVRSFASPAADPASVSPDKCAPGGCPDCPNKFP